MLISLNPELLCPRPLLGLGNVKVDSLNREQICSLALKTPCDRHGLIFILFIGFILFQALSAPCTWVSGSGHPCPCSLLFLPSECCPSRICQSLPPWHESVLLLSRPGSSNTSFRSPLWDSLPYTGFSSLLLALFLAVAYLSSKFLQLSVSSLHLGNAGHTVGLVNNWHLLVHSGYLWNCLLQSFNCPAVPDICKLAVYILFCIHIS